MAKTLSIKNIYDTKRHRIDYMDGIYLEVFGRGNTTPERKIWLIYGKEKHGKTWFSLILANYFAQYEKVLYVSAEEGNSDNISDTLQRIGVPVTGSKLNFTEYEPIYSNDKNSNSIAKRLQKRYAPKIIFIDNLTVYKDEFYTADFLRLRQEHKDKLFIFLAHEERGEPYTAIAKNCSRFAEIIINVKELTCHIGGRCNGGTLTINEEKAMLLHGSLNNN